MRLATLILQNAVRLLALILLVLGFQFWVKHSYGHLVLHMRLGQMTILLLWALAWIALRAGVKQKLVLLAILYGFFVAVFAIYMGRLLPGRAHEAIRVLHFLLGLGAIGLAESLGAKIKRGLA